MKANQDGRYLIDSYVEEVGSQLPMRQRGDIQAEIRSLLEDTLEDRLSESGGKADVEMVASLLEEFGSPKKMAVQYAPDRYLVGPKLFSLFLLVLKTVFSVIIVLGLIGAGIVLSQAASLTEGIEILIQHVIDLAGTLMTIFGNIVIVFAILERVLPESEKDDEDWDPRKMERVADQDKIGRVEVIVGMVFATIGVIVFNFFPQLVRGISFSDGQMHTFQILDVNFLRFIPWLTALWVLEILFSIVLLWRRVWEPTTRWIRAGIDVLEMVFLAVLIFGGPLIATTPEALASWPSENLVPLAETGLRIALGIALVMDGVSLVETLVKQFKKKALKVI
jgi:HAAS